MYARDILGIPDVVIPRNKPSDYEPGPVLSLVDVSDVQSFLLHAFFLSFRGVLFSLIIALTTLIGAVDHIKRYDLKSNTSYKGGHMPIKYAVISQAMKGIDPSKVKLQREKDEAAVRAAGYEPTDTAYEEGFDYGVSGDDVVNPALWYMGLALARLSKACAIYMCDGCGGCSRVSYGASGGSCFRRRCHVRGRLTTHSSRQARRHA